MTVDFSFRCNKNQLPTLKTKTNKRLPTIGAQQIIANVFPDILKLEILV